MTDQEFEGSNPPVSPVKLKITLVADRSAVDPVVHKVMAIVRQMKCAAGKDDAIELSLSEALANAVVHGAKLDANKLVECEVIADETQGVLIIVRDPGEGFDPDRVPNPVDGENLYAHHGRGVYLIRQLMDEVTYAKNGTEIRMRKK